MTITFLFEGDLRFLLRGKWKESESITISIDRRASVKDVIESFGIPHTEVGFITIENREIDFSHIVEMGNIYTVKPISVPWNVVKPSYLRPIPLPAISFLVDVNVGRLAKYLRAAGFDTLYDSSWKDEYISDLIYREKRILLTRDMRLLMRKHVTFGRYIRKTNPVEQLQEVVELFGLEKQISPFTRCLECNALLHSVAKEKIIHRLEPLTKKYYSSFSQCPHCDKIYWPGSHIDKMRRLFSG